MPHLPYRVNSVLRWLSGGGTTAPWRVYLRHHPCYVPLYAAELPCLAQRFPETAGLVDEPKIQRLRTRPHPSSGDAFEAEKLHSAPPRDTILELGVDASDLAFDHPQFVRAWTSSRVEKSGMRPPLQCDWVDAQLFVESERGRTDGQHAYRTRERAAARDDVARRRRDVVAARGGRIPHKDDDRFLGADALDLAPDQIRSQRVAAG